MSAANRQEFAQHVDTFLCSLLLIVFVGAPIAFIGWLVW